MFTTENTEAQRMANAEEKLEIIKNNAKDLLKAALEMREAAIDSLVRNDPDIVHHGLRIQMANQQEVFAKGLLEFIDAE